MTSKLKLFGASAAAISMLVNVTPALATTAPGTDILNNVSVDFAVGGVNQTQINQSNTFKVDRKVLFTLVEKAPVGTTTVAPGQQDAKVAYTLTNSSNDILDFDITAANLIAGGAAPRGTDNMDAANLLICLDANNDNACDAAATATLTVNDLARDGGSVTILVLGDIAANETTSEIAGITLTANAKFSDGTAFVLAGVGKNIANDTDVNVAGTVETILADAGRNGTESALDDYTVAAANLTVTKLSRVVSDGVSATNPKAIPGAVVEYCISVTNAASAATATGVQVSDDLGSVTMADVTFDSTFTPKLDGTVVSGSTCTPGATNATYSGGANGIVSGTLTDIAAGETRTLVFRVTID